MTGAFDHPPHAVVAALLLPSYAQASARHPRSRAPAQPHRLSAEAAARRPGRQRTALAHAHVPSAMKTQISGSAAALPLVADRPSLTAPPGSHATDQFHSTPFAQAIVSCGIRDRRHPTTPTDRAGT